MKRRVNALSGAAICASMFALAACDSSGGSAPGAVSQGEAQALEEAAEMLDERRLPEGTLSPVGPAAEPEAGAESTSEEPSEQGSEQ